MIIRRRYKLIQIMHTHIITKELVLTEKETTMKRSNSLLWLFKQNPQKQISITTEASLTVRKNNLITQFMIMKTQLKLTQITLRLFTTEHFAGINQESSKNRSKIMKMQLNFSLLIFQHCIILEPLEKRQEEISLIWLWRILKKSLRSTLSMRLHTMEEVQFGTDFINLKKPSKTLPKPSASILKTLFTFIIEVAATETWVNLNYPFKTSTWPYSSMTKTQLSILTVDLSTENQKGSRMLLKIIQMKSNLELKSRMENKPTSKPSTTEPTALPNSADTKTPLKTTPLS